MQSEQNRRLVVFLVTFYITFFLHAQQGTTLLPILMYLDGTKLSNNGNHSAKPLSMTIGNFPVHQMNKTSANVFVIFCTQAGQEESEVFWPQLCIVVNDNPEGQMLASIFDGATAEFPCRVCW